MESVIDYKDDAIELFSPYLNFTKSSVQSPCGELSDLSTAEKEKLKNDKKAIKFSQQMRKSTF
eukprot:9593728-Ditylum_brightwellii.AAC.1